MTLDDVLHPLSTETFAREYLGTRYLLMKGDPARFSGLMPWTDLNETLDRLRVTGDRLRLFKGGKQVAPKAYLARTGYAEGSYADSQTLTRELVGGATLALGQVDELFPEVRELAESCEDLLRVYVGVNLYAGWKTDNGFDLHWDEHDTLILQIAGRKHWRVYNPTRLHPIKGDPTGEPAQPSDPPVWEGNLEPGDLLYMPRGWWHVAFPMNEASLHLTVGFPNKTGVSLLSWLTDQAHTSTIARQDLPHWASPDERLAYVAQLKAEVNKRLEGDAIERYMATLDAKAHSRPRFHLPLSVSAPKQGLDLDSPLRLARGRGLHFAEANGAATAMFKSGETTWTCHAGLVPALRLLHHNRPTTIRAMREVVASAVRATLRPYLASMVEAGVVWAEPMNQPAVEKTAVERSVVEKSASETPAAMRSAEAVAKG